jgi:hypothetical protein
MLTNGQKAHLAILSKDAFDKLRPDLDPQFDGIDRDDWRREEVAKACGKFGLTCCGQGDYQLVRAHFLNLLGEPGQALKAMVKAAEEPRQKAERTLFGKLAEYGYGRDYILPICRARFKQSLAECSAGQLWKLVYIVQSNGERKRKKEREHQPA